MTWKDQVLAAERFPIAGSTLSLWQETLLVDFAGVRLSIERIKVTEYTFRYGDYGNHVALILGSTRLSRVVREWSASPPSEVLTGILSATIEMLTDIQGRLQQDIERNTARIAQLDRLLSKIMPLADDFSGQVYTADGSYFSKSTDSLYSDAVLYRTANPLGGTTKPREIQFGPYRDRTTGNMINVMSVPAVKDLLIEDRGTAQGMNDMAYAMISTARAALSVMSGAEQGFML